MEVLAIINALTALMQAGRELGVNIQKLNELVDRADIEGRSISQEELEELASDSQRAIDALRNATRDS